MTQGGLVHLSLVAVRPVEEHDEAGEETKSRVSRFSELSRENGLTLTSLSAKREFVI